MALQAGLKDHEAEEVLQGVLISVVRNIGGFKYDRNVSSFHHWLSTVAHWRIKDLRKENFRKALLLGNPEADADPARALEELPDSSASEPGAEGDGDWRMAVIKAAVRRVKEQVSAKQFQMYYLTARGQAPVKEVCRRLKVNRKQVYLAKHRVSLRVQKELKKLKLKEGG